MAREHKFFQFPLRLNAYGKEPEARLRAGVNYCVVEAGRKVIAGSGLKHFEARLKELADRPKAPSQGGISEAEYAEVLLGAELLDVGNGSARDMLKNHRHIEAFLMQNGGFSKQPFMRLKTSFVWECIDDRGLSYLELSTIGGIYSILGAKNFPFRITRDQIIQRQLGYVNEAEMEKRLKFREDGAEPMTTDQVRYLLDKLEVRGFFARTQASKRVVLFSHRKTHDELLEAAKGWKARKSELKERRAKDRATLFENSPLIPRYNSDGVAIPPVETVPAHSPPVPHEVPTSSPRNPHAVPAIIKTGETAKQLNSETDDILAPPVVSPDGNAEQQERKPTQAVTEASITEALKQVADWKVGEARRYRWIPKCHVDPYGTETAKLEAQLEALKAEAAA